MNKLVRSRWLSGVMALIMMFTLLTEPIMAMDHREGLNAEPTQAATDEIVVKDTDEESSLDAEDEESSPNEQQDNESAEQEDNIFYLESNVITASGVPKVLITEILPHPLGDYRKGSGNQYEYVELYNNSPDVLNLEGYTLWYLYPNTTQPKKWVIDQATTIAPYSTAVIWFAKEAIRDGYDTIDDFNTHYNTTLTEADIIFYDNSRSEDFNLPNTTHRGLALSSKEDPDTILVQAWYDSTNPDSPDRMVNDVRNSVIRYTYPQNGNEMMRLDNRAYGNPGSIDPGQVPPVDGVDMIAPTLELGQLADFANVGDPYRIELSSDKSLQCAQVWYGPYDAQQLSETVPLVHVPGQATVTSHVYGGEIVFPQAGMYRLIIEAEDKNGHVVRVPYSSRGHIVTVGDVVAETPSILITEILPHPLGDYRKGSGNQYEYVELYNNSPDVLNLEGYTLWYLYPNTTQPKKWVIDQATTIAPYSTAVIWFAKEAIRDGYDTIDDFNTHYNTTLTEADIIFYDNSSSEDFNLPNTTHRGLALSSKEDPDTILVQAWYDSTNPDSPDRMVNDVRNSVIRYTYPQNGNEMMRLDNRAYGNPGSIDPGQVPPVDDVDMIAPTLELNPLPYNVVVNQPQRIELISDKRLEQAVVMYGPIEGDQLPLSLPMQLDGQKSGPQKWVYSADLVFTEQGTYRYIVSGKDTSGHETRVPYNSRGSQVMVNAEGGSVELPQVGLSVESTIKGTAGVFAYGNQASDVIEVSLDGHVLDTKPALPGVVQFGFQSRGIDLIYHVAGSATKPNGELEYFARISPIYVPNAWYLYDLKPDYFVHGSTVSIHSGNENEPYERSLHDKYFGKANYDDFEIMNIHLVLPDGTLIKPDSLTNDLGNLKSISLDYRENTYYALGDGDSGSNPNKALISHFHFAIPEEKYTARYAEIDTSRLPDGTYTLTMSLNGQVVDSQTVQVDNTEPVIHGLLYGEGKQLVDGMRLKGSIRLDVNATDAQSGIARVESTLNGETISLPHNTSSVELAPGKYVLHVKVYDVAGNMAEMEKSFHILDERPNAPEQIAPRNLAAGVQNGVLLQAKISDPDGDKLKAQFLVADQYDSSRTGKVRGFVNVADREPPLTVSPEGEVAMSQEDMKRVQAVDGKALVTDAQNGFPYHRFEVELEQSLRPTDTVELYWQGSTLPGRIVTLYAWDYEAGKWVGLQAETGQSVDQTIVLTTEIEAGKFVRNNKIQAMVQDEVPGAHDPFTILWFTDTQYYAQSYPEIFDRLGDYISDEYKKGTFSYAIHTGDIVNIADDEQQWAVADRNLKKLDDAGVPYGVLAGNHDMIIDGIDYTYYKKYVGKARYENNPWYGGQMDDNRNHYDLYSFGGHDFIFLYIGFGLEDTPETIAWANEVLKKHSDRNAIIGMHAYLESNGTLSNMAQNVFDQVIVPNENVLMVLCGHYHAARHVVKTIQNPDGSERQLIEMLANYQGGPNGGNGYLRYLHFDPLSSKLSVQTYSPYLDDYNFFDDATEEFSLDIQLRDANKRVATDYFAVNVYTEQVIGGTTDFVESGSVVSARWSNLQANKTHYWYMNIVDEYGALRRSDIFRFTTGSSSTGTSPDTGTSPQPGADRPKTVTDPVKNGPQNGPQNPVQEEAPGSVLKVKPKITDGTAIAELNEQVIDGAFRQAVPDRKGIQTVSVEFDLGGTEHKGAFELRLPSSVLAQTSGSKQLLVATTTGSITVPVNMLHGQVQPGRTVSLLISAERAGDSLSGQAGADDVIRHVVELGLRLDGETFKWSWSNNTSDMTVTLPYTLQAGERPEGVIVYAIGEDGSMQLVRSGKYVASSNVVVFQTKHFGRYAVAYYDADYIDVADQDWFAQAVHFLSARQIIQGSGHHQFKPNQEISRADFLIMAMNTFGVTVDPSLTDNFADAGNAYFAPYLATAKQLGLVQGKGDNLFAPRDSITRQDMAVMLYNMIHVMGLEFAEVSNSAAVDSSAFADIAQVSKYARPAVEYMLQAGLMQGVGNAEWMPKKASTRATAAQVMYNYLVKE